MQAMKLDKDNAMERALQSEQQARDANLRAEKAEEEARALQKKIQSIENELDQTQEGLMQVNAKLEEKNKALQNGPPKRPFRREQPGEATDSAMAEPAHGPDARPPHSDDPHSAAATILSRLRDRPKSLQLLEKLRGAGGTDDNATRNRRTPSRRGSGVVTSDQLISRSPDGAEDDPETQELARLRCPSECTEVIAEREIRRRQRRCADYPGFAFGSSMFSSDSMMKFNIIKNELHNIMNTQLKRSVSKAVGKMTANMQQGTLLDVLKKKMRQTKEEMEKYKDECEEYHKKLQVEVMRREEAEGEVAALNRRIQLLEEDLERSEERLSTATQKLAEASQAADESERIRKALENRTNMEDDRVAILESQLAQAKLIAEEADKKYEEGIWFTVVFSHWVEVLYSIECVHSMRKVLENRSLADEERMDALENQLKEARFLAEEADKKYDEVARKLAMVEADLERAEERADTGES
ncbi:Hypothetical predicted protein [Cloeon dipterum]|nr:Hypothetical predicted protein [Cloeon dipterum]